MKLMTIIFIVAHFFLTNYLSHSQPRLSNEPQITSGYNRMSFSAVGPEYISKIVALSATNWVVTEGHKIWKTINAGGKWTSPVFPGIQVTPELQVGGICFVNADIGFVVLGNHLFITESMGDNWLLVSRIVPDTSTYYFADIFFLDSKIGWVVGSRLNASKSKIQKAPVYEGFILATTDSGKTWKEQSLPKVIKPQNEFKIWPLRSIFFITENTGCAVGDGVILYTSDGGDTWNLAKSMSYDFTKIKFLDPIHGWAIVRGSKSFVITEDGGRTWRLQSINVPCNAGTMNIELVSSNSGISVCPSLYRTDDMGKTWQRVQINSSNMQLTYDYLVRAITGSLIAININRNKVNALVSNDGGKLWESVQP